MKAKLSTLLIKLIKGAKKRLLYLSAGSKLPCSNQICKENPEDVKEAQIQLFLADLRAISQFCRAFKVDRK